MSQPFFIKALAVIEENKFSDNDFFYKLHLEIAKKNDDSSELLQVLVVSPKYLEKQLAENDILIGRKYIITNFYDEKLIKERIKAIFEYSNASGWEVLGSVVGKYFDWI